MVLQKARAKCRPCLEKISPHSSSIGSEKPRNLRGFMTLQVNEVEDFALFGRQLREENPDVFRDSFPVDSRTRVGVVNVVGRERRFCKLSLTPILTVPFKRNPSRDAIHPSLDCRVTAILRELPMNPNERLLRDLVGLVRIPGERQGPAVHEAMKDGNQALECGVVSCGSERDCRAQHFSAGNGRIRSRTVGHEL
jgi:hypothetical protein